MGVDHVEHGAGARPPTQRDDDEPRGSGQVATTLFALVVRRQPFQVAALQKLLRGKVLLARTPAVRVDRRALLFRWLLGHERPSPSPSERYGGSDQPEERTAQQRLGATLSSHAAHVPNSLGCLTWPL